MRSATALAPAKRRDDAVFGLRDVQRLEQTRRTAHGLRPGGWPRATCRGSGRRPPASLGQVERRLPAKLDDHTLRAFALDHVQHVLQRQRLEIEPVGGVVIGRDRLRVAVEHDGLEAHIGQGKSGLTATIVELDALADAVRAAAQDQDLCDGRWGRPHPGIHSRCTYTACARRTRRRRCPRDGRWPPVPAPR